MTTAKRIRKPRVAKIDRAVADVRETQAYTAGIEEGRRRAKLEGNFEAERRKALIQLISAVGQTMDVNARLMQGLASALDASVR